MSIGVKALTFDVFGTVVDYRTTIIREGQQINQAKGLTVDWGHFSVPNTGMYKSASRDITSRTAVTHTSLQKSCRPATCGRRGCR